MGALFNLVLTTGLALAVLLLPFVAGVVLLDDFAWQFLVVVLIVELGLVVSFLGSVSLSFPG